MKKFLNKEHEGVAAIETLILTPLMYICMLFLLYFSFMIFSSIVYNNLATAIASELNMRQTGWENVEDTSFPVILSGRVSSDYESVVGGKILKESMITISPASPYLRGGIYYALDKFMKTTDNADESLFPLPFTEITDIKAISSQAIDSSLNKRLAGTVIRVEIHFKTMNVSNDGIFPTMKAVGYSIIN